MSPKTFVALALPVALLVLAFAGTQFWIALTLVRQAAWSFALFYAVAGAAGLALGTAIWRQRQRVRARLRALPQG